MFCLLRYIFCQNVSDYFDEECLANKGEECTPRNLIRDEKREEQQWQKQLIFGVKIEINPRLKMKK